MDTLKEFAQKFPTMPEGDAIQFLTDHFNELPETLQSEYAAFMLSRALEDATQKLEARMQFHEALLAVLELVDDGEVPQQL